MFHQKLLIKLQGYKVQYTENIHGYSVLGLSLGQCIGKGAPLRGTGLPLYKYGNVRDEYNTVNKHRKRKSANRTWNSSANRIVLPEAFQIALGLPWALARLTMDIACSFRG